MDNMRTIGLVGGTGDLGRALAVHLSRKHKVKLGSRTISKAQAAVKEILQDKRGEIELRENLLPVSNNEAVSDSEIAFLTVPYESALETVKSLIGQFQRGQTLISCAARVSKRGKEFFGESGVSLSRQIQDIVPQCEVATAFQTIPAVVLYKEATISFDVFIACNEEETFRKVAELVLAIDGLRPLYVGTLEHAGQLESLTALLLNVGLRNRLKSPTLKIHSF
jgi:8-hydroxy-5-deazaflavin:NADPH oxidoreductase